MGNKTPLYQQHVEMHAKIVDFGGWEMPINYGSQIQEHHQVRTDAGMFDVSHMTVVDLQGDKVRDFLHYLLANNVDRLKTTGKALYTCMLNEQAGIIDDLIVYFMREDWFRLVVNAATHDKDLAWINKYAGDFAVQVTERTDLAMIAVQGPAARDKVHQLLPDVPEQLQDMAPFNAIELKNYFIARTGYTGEDGYEIMLDNNRAAAFWNELYQLGVKPIGLGARDTLRLEAGMNLYGQDMTESTTPLESGLGWTIGWEPAERDFIGRKALQTQREQKDHKQFVALVLEGKGILRHDQKVYKDNEEIGTITSGSYSPTLEQSIALARVSPVADKTCTVEIRGKQIPAKIVKPPFVRNGKSCLS
jgi:aminomethyltransferase